MGGRAPPTGRLYPSGQRWDTTLVDEPPPSGKLPSIRSGDFPRPSPSPPKEHLDADGCGPRGAGRTERFGATADRPAPKGRSGKAQLRAPGNHHPPGWRAIWVQPGGGGIDGQLVPTRGSAGRGWAGPFLTGAASELYLIRRRGFQAMPLIPTPEGSAALAKAQQPPIRALPGTCRRLRLRSRHCRRDEVLEAGIALVAPRARSMPWGRQRTCAGSVARMYADPRLLYRKRLQKVAFSMRSASTPDEFDTFFPARRRALGRRHSRGKRHPARRSQGAASHSESPCTRSRFTE